MNHWMRAHTIRLIGVLFGLSLMLTACDAEDVLALLDGSMAGQASAAGAAAAEHTAADTDDVDTDDGDDVEGKSERREFQCRRDGVREARNAAPQAAADEAPARRDDAPAKAPADRDDAKDGGDADDGRDTGQDRSDGAPARKPAPAPSERASAGGDGGGSAGSLSAIEQGIFDDLNAARREAGPKALALSAEISRGARSWSCDMAASGNFRHADLRSAGVYGENIAWGQRSAAEVHEGWMNSSGHRANRLSSRWSEYGVGVCEDSGGHLYFTERFR